MICGPCDKGDHRSCEVDMGRGTHYDNGPCRCSCNLVASHLSRQPGDWRRRLWPPEAR
jgi:hypothetical protein